GYLANTVNTDDFHAAKVTNRTTIDSGRSNNDGMHSLRNGHRTNSEEIELIGSCVGNKKFTNKRVIQINIDVGITTLIPGVEVHIDNNDLIAFEIESVPPP